MNDYKAAEVCIAVGLIHQCPRHDRLLISVPSAQKQEFEQRVPGERFRFLKPFCTLVNNPKGQCVTKSTHTAGHHALLVLLSHYDAQLYMSGSQAWLSPYCASDRMTTVRASKRL